MNFLGKGWFWVLVGLFYLFWLLPLAVIGVSVGYLAPILSGCFGLCLLIHGCGLALEKYGST